MHFEQLEYRHLGINGGGLEFLVPQKLLIKPDSRAALEHVRCAGVAQEVEVDQWGRGFTWIHV